MYVDSYHVAKRRPAGAPRLRGARRETTPRTADRPGPVSAAARRTRLSDAIVSQWLLEQVPSHHRRAVRGVHDPS